MSYGLRPPLIDACMAIDMYETLSASMAIDDVVLNNMPDYYWMRSMAHVRDSRYVMNVCDWSRTSHYATYATDIGKLDIDTIGRYGEARNIVTQDDIVVMFIEDGNAIVLDGRIDAGQIDIECKYRHTCREFISDRYCQQLDDGIYVVDTSRKLWRVSWHDVKARRYDAKCLIDDDVEDFYMHEHGNAILKTTGIIALSGGQSINMQDVDGDVKWSAVIRSANRWIAYGDKKECLLSLVSTIEA